MTQEEKILLLAALFHDIGKFEQSGEVINKRLIYWGKKNGW